jgi:hypothetical protein
MSIKFEGKPPFYLGIAEVASAHALDGSVVLRATISVPELRPKSVPVQFIVATEVAKALAEQLPIAVRMAEAQSSKEARVVVPNTRGGDLTPRRPYRPRADDKNRSHVFLPPIHCKSVPGMISSSPCL